MTVLGSRPGGPVQEGKTNARCISSCPQAARGRGCNRHSGHRPDRRPGHGQHPSAAEHDRLRLSTVQSTLNGDTTDYPFNNPFVDQFLQNVGNAQVFSSQYAPNGHIKQLVAGLSATNKLVLQHPGVFGSQAVPERAVGRRATPRKFRISGIP